LRDGNSNNCSLYVGLLSDGVSQQIRIYKDSYLTDLVSVGQSSTPGLINLIEQNSSGLTGSVVWDGNFVYSPSFVYLSCGELSSSSSSSSSSIDSSSSSSFSSQEYSESSQSQSSSSSSSSIDSSSSSSSEDYSSTSESSTSESSSSSSSNSSSSSSSSLDSSSSSSESFGNFSSSSSSSVEIWDQKKPLVLGISSASNLAVMNRIAQTFKLTSETYSVGKIYIYLYKTFGFDDSYQINLSIYNCDEDGKPQDIISTSSINASEVNRDDWYGFEFDLSSQNSPENRYLSIVFSHEGNENNYVLWGYSLKNKDDSKFSWVSEDLSDWVGYDNATFSFKIVDIYNPFDEDSSSIIAPAAGSPTSIIDEIENGSIEYQNTIVSFVVDSSGSMSNQDRYNNRKDIVNCLVNKFIDNYSSDVRFSIFTFGGKDVELSPILNGLGTFSTINLDFNNPSRTTYTFSVSNSFAEEGSIYEVGGKEYSVKINLERQSLELVTIGEELPNSSGILNKVSGNGDSTIEFSSFSFASVNDLIISYGFKYFENAHTYNIGDLYSNTEILDSVDERNWQLFHPQTQSPSISTGNNSPGNSESIDIFSSSDLISRKMFTRIEILSTEVTSILYAGESSIEVVDASIFRVDDHIDILEGEFANIDRIITGIDGNTITFTPEAKYPIQNNNSKGSIVQQSSISSAKSFYNPTTAKILVRDIESTRSIIFYLQNTNGDYIEWDFFPSREWQSYNIFFFGSTAILPISLFEKDGTPLPNGTRVDLYVNQKPEELSKAEKGSSLVTRESSAGESRIYLSSTSGFARNQTIDIIDNLGNFQTDKIEEIGEDSNGPYIEILGSLAFDVSSDLRTSVIAKIQINNSEVPSNNLLPNNISCVDVTPVVNNGDIDESLLQPYDINRVPYSTPYEDLNLSREYIQKNTIDMPTINGNSCIRILPITEDILETIKSKNEEFSKSQEYSNRLRISSQLEINDGDIEEGSLPASTPEQKATQDGEVNYFIETPVFSSGGIARSSMISYDTDFEENTGSKIFPELSIGGIQDPIFLTKKYDIYSSVSFFSTEGNVSSEIFLDPFQMYFISPIIIESSYVENDNVRYYLPDQNSESCELVYSNVFMRGNHASSGKGITIKYTVAEEFSLIKNGFLNITIYSNKVDDLENFASLSQYGGKSLSEQFANIKPLKGKIDDDGNVIENYYTYIDKWREDVKNNPFQDSLSSAQLSDIELENIKNQISNLNSPGEQEVVNEFSQEGGSQSGGIFYSNPYSWTLASQYGESEFSIPIVDGKATLNIPESDIVSLIFIEASYSFGDGDNGNEHIIADAFFIANPITITEINPKNIVPSENKKYEIGVGVEYFNGEIPIQDNTQVNFSFSQDSLGADIVPTSSVTDDGWAGGIFIGPVDPIPPEPISPLSGNVCPVSKDINVAIEVFHSSGYRANAERRIRFSASSFGEDVDSFLFYAQDSTSFLYSDGSIKGDSKVVVDLDDSFNSTDLYVGEDGIRKLRGEGQPDGEARILTAPGSTPSKSKWSNAPIELRGKLINKNIGHQQPLPVGELSLKPWFSPINAVTSYLSESGNYISGQIASGPAFVGAFGQVIIPKPNQSYVEPLDINVSFEGSYARNGIDSASVCATIEWKGEHLKNKFIINPGTEFESSISYPFPKVRFESGICLEDNLKAGRVTSAKDARNLSSGCLVVGDDDNCVLSSYSVQSGLFRSSIHTETDSIGNIISIHTHETEIDEMGNGSTVSTIVIFGAIDEHEHEFNNYQSNESLSHSHGLRSVAITTLLPTQNIDTDFVINGYVVYDPTNCEPFENEPSNPEGNRMMFSTLEIPANNELARTLVSKIEVGSDLRFGEPAFVLDYPSDGDISKEVAITSAATFYTASDVEETSRGFDVRVTTKFSEYSYIDGSGNEVIIPEELVDDGSRLKVEITPFKPSSVGDSIIMSEGVKRDYMNLKFKTSISIDNFNSTREFIINIASLKKWYPFIRNELPRFTNDRNDISKSIENFGFFGSSQIYDAMKVAAEAISEYQNEDEIFKDYKKIIFLISDGDENSSDNSLRQSINAINFIDGMGEVNVFPIQLGKNYQSDSINLKNYSVISSNDMFYLEDSEDDEIQQVCEEIVSGEANPLNKDFIIGNIVFEEGALPERFSIPEILVPPGSDAYYRIRSSSDGINFSSWSRYIDYSSDFIFDKSIDSLQKYLQYEITLLGNSNFESPIISNGVKADYYPPREFIVFFKPNNVLLKDDEYISSIQITSEIERKDSSIVNFLFTQSDSIEPSEYLEIEENNHYIFPNRFNEILETDNFQTYRAINGSWQSEYKIELYKVKKDEINGQLIDPKEYTINPREGTINFKSSQESSFTIFISVFFASSFRIAARIKNFADDPAVINHIGIIYNISSRVYRDKSGNIIRLPINRRIN
jgi:Mg-chelatase subunit ChlD